VERPAGIYVLAMEDRICIPPHICSRRRTAAWLRDLTDLDLLLRDVALDLDFWPRLTARADELQLSRSLFYALRYLPLFS